MESYKKSLKLLSRNLRNQQTDAENKLWQQLRRKQILNAQFNRQKPILNFIVDFYCAKAKLIIEIDGGQHFEKHYQLKDEVRDKTLSDLGLRVLRFDNKQVLVEMDAVLQAIYEVMLERIKS